jgi:hypothetical protein
MQERKCLTTLNFGLCIYTEENVSIWECLTTLNFGLCIYTRENVFVYIRERESGGQFGFKQ